MGPACHLSKSLQCFIATCKKIRCNLAERKLTPIKEGIMVYPT